MPCARCTIKVIVALSSTLLPNTMLHECICILTQGIHYTERSRPAAPLARLKDSLTVSTSFHTSAQLRVDWGAVDYAFLSPVYDSISKEGYGAAFGEAELGAALAAATVPVVALGGEAPHEGGAPGVTRRALIILRLRREHARLQPRVAA